jgi:SAM-dependent methyltransferase
MRPPELFDRSLHRRRLDRAAKTMGAAEFLRVRAAEDTVDRLLAVNRRFGLALELGSRRGEFARALTTLGAGRVDLLVESDLSSKMLRRAGARVQMDEERLALKEGGLDLIVSLLALHWTNDLVGALIQIRAALRPDGLFLGAILGGSTLVELRQAFLEADSDADEGAGPRVSPFADAIDGAGLLQRAGFALPVADIDRVTVTYGHPLELLRDLRAMGETGVLVERSRRPLSRGRLMRMSAVYQERFGLSDGRIPATFEIINLSGWAPSPSQPQPAPRGSAKMPLGEALKAIRRAREEEESGGQP